MSSTYEEPITRQLCCMSFKVEIHLASAAKIHLIGHSPPLPELVSYLVLLDQNSSLFVGSFIMKHSLACWSHPGSTPL